MVMQVGFPGGRGLKRTGLTTTFRARIASNADVDGCSCITLDGSDTSTTSRRGHPLQPNSRACQMQVGAIYTEEQVL